MAKRRRKKSAMAPSQAKRAKADASTMPPVLPLPDDLVDAVFVRLPARTVAACRCVSPAWNGRLSSPAFAEVFHAFSAAARGAGPTFVSVPVDPTSTTAPSSRTRYPVPTGSSRCEDYYCPRVFLGAGKTCHGMFLLGRPCDGAFDACNPSTGGVLRLPPRRPESHLLHSAGLGYDAAAGAHKAVLLERVEDDLPRLRPRRRIHPRLQCFVVTVGGEQQPRRWRAPRGPRAASVAFHDAIVSPDIDPVFADGCLHWKLHEPTGRREDSLGEPNGILSFSVGSESFSRIPLPSFAAAASERRHSQPSSSPSNRTQSQCTTMGELDGRLCMVRDLRGDCKAGAAVLEVWKLHYGHESAASSWSLDCRVDLGRIDDWALPWILTAVSPLRYMDGERRRILLSAMEQTAAAYIYDLDSGGLQTVARSSYIGTECTRFFLCQESPLHIAGTEYGTQVVKFDHIYI